VPGIKTPAELRRAIARLQPHGPMTERWEAAVFDARSGNARWYKTQKQHWLGWLADYTGPGAYGRQNWDRSARFVYNHVVCPPMLLWLGEASGVSRAVVAKAADAAMREQSSYSARCAAIRRVIAWDMIERQLV
jgi:hypothetical protein